MRLSVPIGLRQYMGTSSIVWLYMTTASGLSEDVTYPSMYALELSGIVWC